MSASLGNVANLELQVGNDICIVVYICIEVAGSVRICLMLNVIRRENMSVSSICNSSVLFHYNPLKCAMNAINKCIRRLS